MEPNIYAINIPDAKLMAKGAWDLSVYITDLEMLKTITPCFMNACIEFIGLPHECSL